MRVYGLDASSSIQKEFEYIQLLWTRRYYEPGNFVLYMPASSAAGMESVDLVSAEGREELAYLYKPQYEATVRGSFVTCYGRFVEDLANDVTTYLGKDIKGSQSLNTQLTALLGSLVSGEATGSIVLTQRDEVVEKHKLAGEEIYRILKAEKESFRIIRSGSVSRIKYIKARDKTDLVFDLHLGNLKSAEHSEDWSDYYHKCVGYIEIPKDVVDAGYTGTILSGGKYYDRSEYTSTLAVTPRMQKRVLSRDFTLPEGLECTAANKTRIRSALTGMCKLELLNHYVERDIDVDPIQIEGCRYLEDYDLGDIITVRIPELDLTYEAQIIEVQETWEKNHQKIKLKLGNKRMKR